jgi:hypothetical protein
MATATETKKSAEAKSGESKPVFSFRSGRVWASVFSRSVSNKAGKVYDLFSTSIQKSYKDQADEWAYTSNFDTEDLADVQLATHKAFEFIRTQKVEQAAE